MKALAILAAVLASPAIAQTVTVTRAPGQVQLFNPQGTKVGTFPTMEECENAAEAAPPPGIRSSCRPITYITKVGTCDAAEPPELPTEQGEALSMQCPADPNRWFIRALGWTRLPFSNTPESCSWKLELLPKEADPPICHAPLVGSWERDDPESIAETPPIDPAYDEFDPVGPIDDGAPGAPTVDKVAAVTP